MALQIRRGPNAQRATILLQTGEVAWTTDTKKLYVGDGVTTGGVNILANIAGTGFVWNPSTEQLDLAGSTITGINADNVAETNGVVPRLWYRSSLGKTHASEIFTTGAGAAHSGISFSWDDVNQKLSATVLTENAIDAVGAALVAGVNTGISFTYGPIQDAALSGVGRIDATVSSEYIQDTVNDLITAGVHTGITFSYSDSLNSLSAAVNMGGNLVSNLGMNAKDITGTGNINITGTVTSTKTVTPQIDSGTSTGVNITADGTAPLSVIGIGTLTPGTGNINFNIRAAKGSIASPTTTAAGDYLGGVNIQGYTGSTYKNAASMQALWVPGSTLSDTYPAAAVAINVGGGGSVLHSAVLGPQGVFTAPIFLMTNYATTAYPSGGPISFLSGVTITGVAGQFQCTSTTLKVGGTVTIRGTLAGVTISGYASPTTYYIVATNGTTTFTLSTTNGGSGVTTSGTTPTGVVYELSLPQKGMIIFDTTTNKFMGYNGTGWVAFTGP